jgi:hypothetical protein
MEMIEGEGPCTAHDNNNERERERALKEKKRGKE